MKDKLPAGSGQQTQDQPTADKTTSYQPPAKPAGEKEVTGSLFKEGEPRVREKKEFEPPAEVKEWVEEVKTAEEITLPKPVEDEYGQILVKAVRPIKLKVDLPLTKPKIKKALKKKIVNSVRWLAEWCLRLVKMFPKRVSYGSSN